MPATLGLGVGVVPPGPGPTPDCRCRQLEDAEAAIEIDRYRTEIITRRACLPVGWRLVLDPGINEREDVVPIVVGMGQEDRVIDPGISKVSFSRSSPSASARRYTPAKPWHNPTIFAWG